MTTEFEVPAGNVQLLPLSPLLLVHVSVLAKILVNLAEQDKAAYACVGMAKSDNLGDGRPLLCLMAADQNGRPLGTGQLYVAQAHDTAEAFVQAANEPEVDHG